MKCVSTKILAVFLLLLPSIGMAAEQTMGRLFFTPGQRARMDVARQQERSVRFDVEQQDDASPPTNVTLNGVVTRSDGKTTVWINNRIQTDASQTATVGKRGEIRIITPEAGRSVPLQVGQSIDMSSGKVEERYRRPPPAPVVGKETPPATTPGVEKSPVPPNSRDDALDPPVDVRGETPPSR